MEEKKQTGERLKKLLEVMQFTEEVSNRIYGLDNEEDILPVINRKFSQSHVYTAVILKLDKKASTLHVAKSSISAGKMKSAEKIGKFRMYNFSVKLDKSDILSRVVKSEETIHFSVRDLVSEFFPKALVTLIWKTLGFKDTQGIVTPLKKHGQVIGVFSISAPELVEEFIPTVKSFVQHISTALDLAQEYTERRNAEAALRKRFKELNCLYSISNLLHKNSTMEEILKGTVNLLIPSWQYTVNTCARITLGDQEYKTGNFRETVWKQASDIKVSGKKQGAVEVCYLKEKPEADEGPFLSEERSLINAVADQLGRIVEYIQAQEEIKTANRKLRSANKKLVAGEQQLKASNQQLIASEQQLESANYDLDERVKEQTCLYGISRLMKKKNATIKGVLGGTAKLIQSSWQYPEITCVRIIYDDQEFRTDNFEETTWRQAVDIKIDNIKAGVVEVYYLKEKPAIDEGSFLKEERDLLNAIVEELGRFIEQKHVENILNIKENAIESSINAIALADLEGNLTYVNPSFIKMWGFMGEAEVLGKSALKFWQKEEDALNVISNIKKSGAWVGEMNAEKMDGSHFVAQLSANVVKNKRGEPVCMIAFFVDITEQVRAEEALRESENRYRTLFEGSTEGIIFADIETKKFEYANKTLCEMLGYNELEIVEKSVLDIHPKESLAHVIDEFMAQANGEKTLAEDIPCLKKDGTIIYADINTRPMVLNGRKFNVGFFRDITKRKRAEEEKTMLEEQMRQGEKLRAVGELAGGIAHDFNNMLGAISGYADLIEETNRDEKGNVRDKDLEKRVNVISRASNRAADLVAKLLAFSRRGKFRNCHMDIHEIADDTFSLLERSIDRKILIKKSFTAECSTMKGDSSQLQNALLNICLNACDAMKEGGLLELHTANKALQDGQYHPEIKTGEYIVISIKDTGTGMDKETLSRVFEPFFTTKEVGEGTGLGLSSALGTIQSHHGIITAASSVGVGTAVTIYLPLTGRESDSEEKMKKEKLPRGSGTIMIVDDEEMICELTKEILIRSGYTVHMFEDSEKAVSWYEKNYAVIDLVLLDMIMPKMDGRDCFNKMIEVNPDIKVILASGFSKSNKVQNLLDIGALGFVEKPFDRYELCRIIEKALTNGRESGKKNTRNREMVEN